MKCVYTTKRFTLVLEFDRPGTDSRAGARAPQDVVVDPDPDPPSQAGVTHSSTDKMAESTGPK